MCCDAYTSAAVDCTSRGIMKRTVYSTAAAPKRAKSEDLSKTKKQDDEDNEAYDGMGGNDSEEERDMFERMRRETTSVWKDGGAEKDGVLQTLIQKFGMIIHVDAEGNYIKLPSASKAIAKISK